LGFATDFDAYYCAAFYHTYVGCGFFYSPLFLHIFEVLVLWGEPIAALIWTIIMISSCGILVWQFQHGHYPWYIQLPCLITQCIDALKNGNVDIIIFITMIWCFEHPKNFKAGLIVGLLLAKPPVIYLIPLFWVLSRKTPLKAWFLGIGVGLAINYGELIWFFASDPQNLPIWIANAWWGLQNTQFGTYYYWLYYAIYRTIYLEYIRKKTKLNYSRIGQSNLII